MRRASTDRHGFYTSTRTHTHTHLCLGDRAGAFVFLRQEEADGHEELVDADAELLFILAPRGQGEEATGLDDVLEDVLAGLEDGENSHCLRPVISDWRKHPASLTRQLKRRLKAPFWLSELGAGTSWCPYLLYMMQLPNKRRRFIGGSVSTGYLKGLPYYFVKHMLCEGGSRTECKAADGKQKMLENDCTHLHSSTYSLLTTCQSHIFFPAQNALGERRKPEMRSSDGMFVRVVRIM